MSASILEHINFSVNSPHKVADDLCSIFDWRIIWAGSSLDNGETIHVGGEQSYVALYTHADIQAINNRDHKVVANLNHFGVVVNDLDEIERKVVDHGFKPFNHRDYKPGRRFYFLMDDDIEVEVISYQS